jgi:hypothetical protein
MNPFVKWSGLALLWGAAAFSQNAGKVDELRCRLESPGNEDFTGWKIQMPMNLVRKTIQDGGSYSMTLGQEEVQATLMDRNGKALQVSAILESYHAQRGQEAAHFRCVTVKLSYAGVDTKLTCTGRPPDPFNDPSGAWDRTTIGPDGFPRYVIRAFQYNLNGTPTGDLVFSCSRR